MKEVRLVSSDIEKVKPVKSLDEESGDQDQSCVCVGGSGTRGIVPDYVRNDGVKHGQNFNAVLREELCSADKVIQQKVSTRE